jgi:molybdopterin converting factor subunit 1
MRVTVRLFARLREVAGTGEISFEAGDGATVADLWRDLAFRYHGLDRFGRSVSPAVNGEFARYDTVLADGDEVAFLPPVSGG